MKKDKTPHPFDLAIQKSKTIKKIARKLGADSKKKKKLLVLGPAGIGKSNMAETMRQVAARSKETLVLGPASVGKSNMAKVLREFGVK